MRQAREGVQLLDSMALMVDTKVAPEEIASRHPAAALLEAARATHALKDPAKLQHAALRRLSIALPPALCLAMSSRLMSGRKDVKKSGVYRARMMFDLAFALYSRSLLVNDESNLPRRPIFVWSDSSPQGGRDWLLT